MSTHLQTTPLETAATAPRPHLAVTLVGLALTISSVVVVYVDHQGGNVLAAHLRDAYPDYTRAQLAEDVSFYLTYLTTVGALGVIGWLVTFWLIAARKKSARWVAASLFALGGSVGLLNLLIRDGSGETGLPPLLGWVGVLPSLAGLVLVVLLFWPSRPAERS